jgi:hypothetical protein
MTAKDNALYEIRKHNDFSVLCSDDEETTTETVQTSSTASVAHSDLNASAVPSNTEESGADGFETFTSVRKVKRVIHPKPAVGSLASAGGIRPAGKAKEVVVPKAETSIELYEFPSTLKTNDLRKFLQEFDGHYRLKWINDTSCYVVFDDESLGKFMRNEDSK